MDLILLLETVYCDDSGDALSLLETNTPVPDDTVHSFLESSGVYQPICGCKR